MLTNDKFLFMEYKVVQEKWDRRFGLSNFDQNSI